MTKRRLTKLRNFEHLERRDLCAADWQNATNRLDVDRSGMVEPFDALAVINDINSNGSRVLPSKPINYSGPMLDVNGDGSVGPLDALMVDLSTFYNKRAVVLYFYPKDDTPGCTVEALDFSVRKNQIAELGAELFGVSLDSVGSHRNFADKHTLNFDILADPEKKVTTAYGALTEINGIPIAKRTTFIIGSDGIVKQVFSDVDVLIHGEEVVAALQSGILSR